MSSNFEEEEFFMEPSTITAKQCPNFTAQAVFGNDEIKAMNFHEYIAGKYAVLFFYPLDFTFVCPSEIIAFDAKIAEFKARNCEVVGVSVDSQFAHYAWRNTPTDKGGIGKIAYPLVADITKDIARNYGVLSNNSVAFRGTFIIDSKGVVRASLINDLPIGRSVDEILRLVDAVQFNEQNGEVCPANWKKGKAGMKANAAGVADYLTNHKDDVK